MATSVLKDDEFGDIQIHRVRGRSSLSLRVTPAGNLRITMPPLTPLFMAKRLLQSSRTSIRELLEKSELERYEDGMQIGKSHTLRIVDGDRVSSKVIDRTLHITKPSSVDPNSPEVQTIIRKEVAKLLRKQASHYLPKRLAYLASQHGYTYTNVRFSHASSRWGSCSSNGTISLNIALMKLPFELIDYVLLHELCHTEQMNHSQAFWNLVSQADPEYKLHRKQVKSHTPSI